MKRSRSLALGGLTAALVLTPAVALAAAPTVSVRIEGASRTLLPATNVRGHTGSITKGGAPAGACPATTAAGALDVATHHKWNGSYGTYGLSVTSILGESHPFTSSEYWSIFVNGRYASAGICGLKLRSGEQILFAAVPDKGTEYPIVLSAPAHATTGHGFTVKATYFGAKGGAKPLAGVAVKGAGTTNAKGITTVTATKKGKLSLIASRAGYIRDEVTVAVS
jgi:Domain of unknown function (DUF4430)